MPTNQKKPRASRAERAREENIDEIANAHAALDATGVPRELCTRAGEYLASRIRWLTEYDAARAAEAAKITRDRDDEAKLANELRLRVDGLVADLRDVQKIADERGRALDAIGRNVGVYDAAPGAISTAAIVKLNLARAAIETSTRDERSAVIGILAAQLAIGGQTSAEEWIRVAREAAKAARGAS